jgi:hypothetical protein
VRGSAGGPELAVGRHDIDGYEVIGSQAILASQPADPATQGESRNAGIGACAPGGGQTERLGLVVEVHPLGPPFSTDGTPTGVDTHTTHLGQIDHEPPIAHRSARDVVATATDRHQEMVGAGEIDGMDHVGDPSAASDERGLAVDHAVPDGAGLIIACVARTEQWATHAGREPPHGGLVKDCICASGGDNAQVFHGSLLPVVRP